jgi:FtsP/CotA-like multicopper oxidase with cupredoxin domain
VAGDATGIIVAAAITALPIYSADTINVGPGQRWDVIWTAKRSGRWLLHCHIPLRRTNNNVEHKGGGGLMMILEVAER